MRTFQIKPFKRWAKDEDLTDSDLLSIITEMENGLTGDNLGGHVYKKRITLEGRGKRGGARTIIAYKTEEKAFFMVGFAKNERDNIGVKEEKALKRMAKELLGYSDKQLRMALTAGELIEIAEEVNSNGK